MPRKKGARSGTPDGYSPSPLGDETRGRSRSPHVGGSPCDSPRGDRMEAAVPALRLAPVPSWLGLQACLPHGSEPRAGELEAEPVATGFGAHAHVLLSPRMMTNAGLGPGDWVALAVRGEIPFPSGGDDSLCAARTSALLAREVTLDEVPDDEEHDATKTTGRHVVFARAHPNAKASSPTSLALARKVWMSLGRPNAGDVVLVCPLDTPGSKAGEHNTNSRLSAPSPGEACATTTLRLWALEGDTPSIGSAGDWLARGLDGTNKNETGSGSRQLAVLESLARRALDGRCLLPGNLVRLPLLGASAYFVVEEAQRGVVGAGTSVRLLSRTSLSGSRDEATKTNANHERRANDADDDSDDNDDANDPGLSAGRRAERAGRAFASASDASGGYASLGGVSSFIQSLKELVELPLQKPELFTRCGVRPPRGVLLWGPPGTGKTRLARAAAAEAGASLLVVRGPELVTAAVGESEAALKGVFAAAAKLAPCVVLLDELDAIAPARSGGDGLGGRGDAGESGGDQQMSARVVAALLSVLDGADSEISLHRVVVVATTNRPDAIDRALRRPGRFDREIEIGVPTPSGRLEIFHAHLKRLTHELTEHQITQLAQNAHGFVGADVAALCSGAAMSALRRRVSWRENLVGKDTAQRNTPCNDASAEVTSFDGDSTWRTVDDDLTSSMRQISIKDDNTKERENNSVNGTMVSINDENGTKEKSPKKPPPTVTYADFVKARRSVKPSALRELAAEYPKVEWDDVGGLADVKQKLREAVEWSELHGDAMRRIGAVSPNGTLLYGPPGCSKTMLARAVASASGRNFVTVKGPELHSKYVGESEKAVRALFTRAKQAAPSVIFLDELDGLVGARGKGGQRGGPTANDRVLTQLLGEMDGLSGNSGNAENPKLSVAVIAATNRPDLVDGALLRPGRFDRLLFVPPPVMWEDRLEIITRRARKTPLGEDVDLKMLALSTAGFTGADLNAFVREAAMAALEENIESGSVSARHFALAALRVRATPAPSAALAATYKAFQRGGAV